MTGTRARVGDKINEIDAPEGPSTPPDAAQLSRKRARASIRRATPDDAGDVARLLHDFNTEFGDPTPGVAVLTQRLEEQLARDDVAALLAAEDGLALITFRPTVWDAGPVALLEELYVVPEKRGERTVGELIQEAFVLARRRGSETFQVNVDEPDVDAQRFYERHGVSRNALYFEREL